MLPPDDMREPPPEKPPVLRTELELPMLRNDGLELARLNEDALERLKPAELPELR